MPSQERGQGACENQYLMVLDPMQIQVRSITSALGLTHELAIPVLDQGFW